MNDNRRIFLTLIFGVIVAAALLYSLISSPSLAEIRKAREMMRADMKLVRRESLGIIDFDDDRKTKVGGAILSIEIASDSWGKARISKCESMLSKLGWVRSSEVDGKIFMCKGGASTLLMDGVHENKMNGFVYMTYPADSRAKCPP